jgi:putative ABC transport system permease protein
MTSPLTLFTIITKSIQHRPLRTALTLLGIIVGVGSVFSLFVLGQGLTDAVQQQFDDIGTDTVLIQPRGGFGVGGAQGLSLTGDDVDIVEQVRGVGDVSFIAGGALPVSWEDEATYPFIAGIPTDDRAELALRTVGADLLDGRVFSNNERGSAIIGYDYRYGDDFDSNRRVGQSLRVGNTSFDVIGVNEEIGNEADDRTVFIAIDDYEDLVGDTSYAYIIVEIREGQDVDAALDRIRKDLRDYRDEEEGEETFSVQTLSAVVDQFLTIITAVQVVVVGIGGISLFVGAVGISNTMYTSILERRKDIGVMKSIGATKPVILSLFTCEAGLLGLIGGVVGVVSGVLFCETVVWLGTQYVPGNFVSASYPAALLLVSVVGSTVIGALSGLIPAWKAASLDPVEALRGE